MRIDIYCLVCLYVVSIHAPLCLRRECAIGDAFFGDDLDGAPDAVACDNVLVEAIEFHPAFFRWEEQEDVPRKDELGHSLVHGDTHLMRFHVLCDLFFDAPQCSFPFLLCGRVACELRLDVVPQRQTKEGRVRREQGKHEFACEVVDATRPDALIWCVILGAARIGFFWECHRDGELGAFLCTVGVGFACALHLLVELSGGCCPLLGAHRFSPVLFADGMRRELLPPPLRFFRCCASPLLPLSPSRSIMSEGGAGAAAGVLAARAAASASDACISLARLRTSPHVPKPLRPCWSLNP